MGRTIVSKKGQKLYALISNAEARPVRQQNPKYIERVSLFFSRQIDFLARLQKAYAGLDLAADYNFYEHLAAHIHFVFGPPGTGKTTHLAKRILERMHNDPGASILVLTPTNKAADVLAMRIINEAANEDNKFTAEPTWLIRFGATAEGKLIEDGYFHTGATYKFTPGFGSVLVTTIHRFLYEQVMGVSNQPELLSDLPWQTIVIDEASMVPLTYINYVLHKRKFIKGTKQPTEFIIGGDPFQLPPIVDIPNEALPDPGVKEENIYSMVGLTTFDPSEQQALPKISGKITNLTTQYRSIRAIGEVFSQFQYNGTLAHGRDSAIGPITTLRPPIPRPLPKEWEMLGIQPLTQLRFTCNSYETIYNSQKLLRSPYQLYSAQILTETIRWMARQLPKSEPHWQIGIVTPYRAQAQLISKLIESISLPDNLHIVVDTVHGFQGDECDMMFVLFNPPASSITGDKRAFLHKRHLVNVAVSRARDYMILVYPDEETSNITNLRLIHDSQAGSVGSVLNRPDLKVYSTTVAATKWEELFFNERFYLSRNTFTNPHQMVNVYGKATLHYTVRADDNTLDVQIKTD